ncbi:MAG: tRNA lysidine(34) synthetase TilS, partial [Thermodesulfobacteriota bacterium]|nr:tRNA lysidine(34) synthetase TilS [Thermodesulfobacteriota bacterium]
VKQAITAYRMFQPGDSVLICVSGGPDSVALLHILLSLAPEFSYTLGIAHLNHCLRKKDSDDDAEFVASLAKQLNLPCYIKKKDVRKYQKQHKLSLEEAARHVRYAFYDQVAKRNGFNKIALGHHSDDNAELVLMYLLRGSGPLGIAGIPPVRNFKNSDRQIVRPLINVKRSEIIDFIEAKELKYVFDKSNNDLRYLRNRVRHQLIPLLKGSYNLRIVETINRLSLIIRCEEKWIENNINSVFKKSIISIRNDKIILSATKIGEIDPAAQRRVIRKAIAAVKGDLRRIAFSHIDSAVSLLKSEKSFASIDLPDCIRIERNKDLLCFAKEKKRLRSLNIKSGNIEPISFEYSIIKPGHKPVSIYIKEINLRLKFSKINIKNLPDIHCAGHNIAFFDMVDLAFPLILRPFSHGDRFQPLGMSGTQKVKSFFINNKISRLTRLKYPMLLSKGKIIWVVGLRIDDSAKIKPSTRIVLKAEF